MYKDIEEKIYSHEQLNERLQSQVHVSELEERKKKLENDINEVYQLFYDIISEVYN